MGETVQELGSQPCLLPTERAATGWTLKETRYWNSGTMTSVIFQKVTQGEGWQSQTATEGNFNTEINENLHSSSKTNLHSTLKLGRLWLTGDLLDLVDHHKGIRQAHLHWVVHRADLRHLDRNLKQKNTTISHCPIWQHQWGKYWSCVPLFPPDSFNLDLCWITRLIGVLWNNPESFTTT